MRLRDGLAGGVDAAGLAGAEADLHAVLDQHDRVGDDAAAEPPGKVQVAQLRLGRGRGSWPASTLPGRPEARPER